MDSNKDGEYFELNNTTDIIPKCDLTIYTWTTIYVFNNLNQSTTGREKATEKSMIQHRQNKKRFSQKYDFIPHAKHAENNVQRALTVKHYMDVTV